MIDPIVDLFSLDHIMKSNSFSYLTSSGQISEGWEAAILSKSSLDFSDDDQ